MSEEITNGYELAKAIEADPKEGVVVILLPEKVENITTQEVAYLDKKGEHCHIVIADCGPWGVRTLDVQSPNEEPMKWWKVKEVAAIAGVQMVPVRWEGPLCEIPSRYFEPPRAGEPEPVVGIRFWQHGPFFFPREKPVVVSEEKEKSSMEEVLKSAEAGIISLTAGA